MCQYANIIVDSRSGKLACEYTYSVPKNLQPKINIGQLVQIPFGRRKAYGVVSKLLTEKPNIKYSIKSIKKTIGERAIVNQSQIKLAHFISQYYYCDIGQALFCMIPSFVYKSASQVQPKYEEIVTLKQLTKSEKESIEKYKKQNEIYQFLKYRRSASWPNIKQKLNISRQTLTSLVKKNIVSIKKEEVIRSPIAKPRPQTCVPELVGSQKKAWQAIAKELSVNKKKPIMLFGRTGSGKTELYLRAAANTLAKKQGVIILVPEIALVPQTLQRFYERFGSDLAVYHSQMSAGERRDQWYRLYNGQAKIVIGSRSALFSPIQNLGLIIIDEEHEYSYKQDSTPRYHAVKVAEKYADLTNSLLVLGSATPRLETFWTAKKGKYQMIRLKKTINETIDQKTVRRPEINIVDLRDEFIAGNRSLLSYSMQESIQKALLSKKQILLFLNRRGHTTYVFCRECGYVAKCPECYIPMTLHTRTSFHQNFNQKKVPLKNALICHHCGLITHNLSSCPECSSPAIKHYGAGTQKIEEEVQILFPHARVLRMDYDTTRTKNAHQKIFSAFKQKKADILIGTQMITKGWDLPNVDLVGIVNADGGFNLPDFRATEKNFSLLLQLIGRVGRGQTPGRVVLQTYDPENPLFDPLLREDYQLFAFSELIERKNGNFPPFVQLVRLLYESSDMNKCKNESIKLFKLLNKKFSGQKKKTLTEILGPTPAYIARIKQKFRWHIILKGHNLQKFLDVVPVGWTIDVDPYSLL